jgi:hypothetical protein
LLETCRKSSDACEVFALTVCTIPVLLEAFNE